MNNALLQRVLTGWTFIRALYLVIGGFVMAQAVMESQWIGLLLGGYFTSMAVFNYGCAAGACAVPYNQPRMEQKAVEVLDVEYEEVGKRP
jgi:hypothetical protein